MGKHITIRDRVIIQYQIENSSQLTCHLLAQTLAIHPSSLYRELKLNTTHHVSKKERYLHEIPRPCVKLRDFPFVCNPCRHVSRCALELIFYDAYEADKQARFRLKSTRSHPQLTKAQLNHLDERVSPRVKCHQSLYHILQSDPSLQVSQSTLRRYIDRQYLTCRNLDLPRTVRFPHPQTSTQVHRKRINIQVLVNRTYQDYLAYTANGARVTLQLDLVIGKANDHRALLTLYEPQSKFQWGYMVSKGATSVNHVLKDLIDTLYARRKLFFDCLLCDNGAEFQALPLLETSSEGEILCRVFYCDPYSSFQKGGCERNHALIRYVIKKGVSLDFVSQDEIDQLFSQINSQKRKSLLGKTPFKAFKDRFRFPPDDFLNLFEVPPSQLNLTR